MTISIKFNLKDRVYFINKHHLFDGEVDEIKANINKYRTNISYKILHTSGDMGAYFEVDENDIYKTPEELKRKMFNGIN